MGESGTGGILNWESDLAKDQGQYEDHYCRYRDFNNKDDLVVKPSGVEDSNDDLLPSP